MRILFYILFALSFLLAKPAAAQLVAPPAIYNWTGHSGSGGTANLNDTWTFGAYSGWSASDNSDGNDWNAGNYQGVLHLCVQYLPPGGSWTNAGCGGTWSQYGGCMWDCYGEANVTFNQYGTWYVRLEAMDWRPWFTYHGDWQVDVNPPQYTMSVSVTGTGCSYAGGNGTYNYANYSYPSVSVSGGYQVLSWSMSPFGVINCSNTAYNCDGSAGAGYPGHTTVSVWMDSNKTVTVNCGSSCTPVAVPTTNMAVNGTDLKNIFKARCTSSSPVAATGFTVGGTDINQYFEPGSGLGYNTNYTVNGNDLRNIFKIP